MKHLENVCIMSVMSVDSSFTLVSVLFCFRLFFFFRLAWTRPYVNSTST